MITAIKLFLEAGKVELVSGQDGVKSIFIGDKGEVVVLTTENIVTYGNVPYIAMKDYAKKKDEE
jgi:hypothetical protein